jgi:hypothetical protein
MIQDDAFSGIRARIAEDMTPVRPIRPGWQTAFVILPLGLAILGVVLAVFGLRGDASRLGAWTLWGPSGILVATAYVLLLLALIQRAPESKTSWLWWASLPLVAIAIQIGGAYWTLHYAGREAGPGWPAEAVCFLGISMLSLPTLLIGLSLLSRGLPLRPRVAGLLTGLAGGVLSEGMYRLHCSFSYPSHFLPWHTGAILAMALLGLLAGVGWERHRARAFAEP